MTTATIPGAGAPRWLRLTGWTVMMLLATAIAGYGFRLAFVEAARPPFFKESPVPWALAIHFAGGGLALLVGAWQFLTGPRAKHRTIHQWMGRAYVVATAMGIGAGSVMASYAQTGLVARVGFTFLAIGTLGTTARGFQLARDRQVTLHREWMTRSYALMLAAVTLRFQIPLSMMQGWRFDQVYPVIAWACWVPNLIVAEWMIRRRRARGG